MIDEWKPVRIDDRYCSPHCGRGCTHKEYRLAMGHAHGLAAELGDEWEPTVWENLGWHFAARIPGDVRVEVHRGSLRPYGGYSWTAFLGNNIVGTGVSPKQAIDDALGKVYDKRRELDQILTALRKEV